ncbi:MAG: hypothetical protein AB1798_06995 [Spirochaetota bacterium]
MWEGKNLKKASKLFRKKRYSNVINLLEPQVFRFRDNVAFFYLLGVSCLYTGDFGGAYSYLKRVLHSQPRDVNSLLGLAAIHLKKHEISEAIMCWLSALEIEGNNKIARYGLKVVKKDSTPEKVSAFVESKTFFKLYPKTGFYVAYLVPVLLLTVFITVTVVVGLPIVKNKILSEKKPRQAEVYSLSLKNGNEKITEFAGQYRYMLTEKEIQKAFEKAKMYFENFDDNLAQVEINRILESNASFRVKDKARIIMGYLKPPDFTTIRPSIPYEDVVKDPYLYKNCYILWRGKIVNIIVTKEQIRFDFLVGYEDEKVLKGIVPVTMNFAANLEQGASIEILGKVTFDNKISIQALSIHKLAP